jgi:hypothetical protein
VFAEEEPTYFDPWHGIFYFYFGSPPRVGEYAMTFFSFTGGYIDQSLFPEFRLEGDDL